MRRYFEDARPALHTLFYFHAKKCKFLDYSKANTLDFRDEYPVLSNEGHYNRFI